MISLLPRPDGSPGLPVVLHRTARRPQTIALLSALVAITLCVAAPDLLAQQDQAAEVPTIEAHFTRVYEVAGATRLRWPSLSPDGRWIVFSAMGEDDEVSLWLVPARGGEPIRLTQGHYDDQPVWFPSGDRIAFRSDRPARGGNGDSYANSYVMSLPIDRETGKPTGPPRQVSVDRCYAWLDVSPDGEWIVFGGPGVVVVPSAGGASRTVARGDARPVWSPDGKSIYYDVDRPEGAGEALIRVSGDGKTTDTIFTWPKGITVFGYPESRFVLREISRDQRRNHPTVWEVATLDGRALGRLELPPGMDPRSFTPAGELLAVRLDMSAPLEVLPIDGGSPRRLNEARGNDQVLGWSGDGRRVLLKTALDGEDMFFFAPTDGGPMRQVRLPEKPFDEFPPVLSKDGRHLLYAVAAADSEALTLKILDLEEGDTREITRNFFLPDRGSFELSGRAGVHWRDGDSFLYVERHGDRYELRAAPAAGAPRLLHTFYGTLPYTIAVYGDRIAYAFFIDRVPDESRSLMLAQAGDDQALDLLTVRGVFQSATWSPDGRYLTVGAYRVAPEREDAPEPAGPELLVLEIDPSSDIIGEPTVFDSPDMLWWSPQWLPSGRGLLVPAVDGNVWRISTEPEVRPVNITGDFTDPLYGGGFRISPDGQYIAYARTIFRGSSIWHVDLGDALAAAER